MVTDEFDIDKTNKSIDEWLLFFDERHRIIIFFPTQYL